MLRDRELLVVYLKGVCMGSADAVPGVSGGTIALIVGIYERLIAAITAVSAGRIRRFLAGLVPGRWALARRAFEEMDGRFLLALGAGILSAVLVVTRVLDLALEAVPVLTFGFFFGLIAASAFVLRGELRLDTRGRKLAALSGFLFAFLVSGRVAAALGSSPLVVFVAGAVAVSAMILPGVSGSLLLVVLGQYEHMVGSLSAFVDASLAVLTGGPVSRVLDPGLTVVSFVGGALVGLFTLAHVVRRALETRREATLAFLVSLIVGALRAPVAEVTRKLAARGTGWSPEAVIAFCLAALVGGGLVLVLERYAGVDLEVGGEATVERI